jgi:hypothetical protein
MSYLPRLGSTCDPPDLCWLTLSFNKALMSIHQHTVCAPVHSMHVYVSVCNNICACMNKYAYVHLHLCVDMHTRVF